MRQQPVPPPPQYWFCVLLDAIRDSDFDTARNANARLRDSGIEVSFRRMIPDLDTGHSAPTPTAGAMEACRA